MTNIRIFFSKKGRAKYISHLDMYRCFQRALNRAEIPVWYTQGFNPRIYMTFPLPLSLGVESERECVDMRLTRDMKFVDIKKNLSPCFPEGINLLYVSEPKHNQKDIAFADYEIKMFCGEENKKTAEDFKTFWQQDEIIVEKMTKKKKIKKIDIKQMAELLSCKGGVGCIVIELRCVAGIEVNLNPSMVIDTFLGDGNGAYTTILRKAVYTSDMEIFS